MIDKEIFKRIREKVFKNSIFHLISFFLINVIFYEAK